MNIILLIKATSMNQNYLYLCHVSSLGQWLMFSQSPYLSFRLFTQFCAYMIFWPVIVKYSNINLHMHIEPPKNILYNVILLAHLSTLHFYLSSSCVPFVSFLDGWHTSVLDCSYIIHVLSCSSIAGSYTHAQQYQNPMRTVLPLKSFFHELQFPISVSYIEF